MKKRALFITATSFIFTSWNNLPNETSISPRYVRAVDATFPEKNGAANHPPRGDDSSVDNERFALFIGSNARWLVDRRLGAITAWDLKRDVPLWTRDGVAYRVARRPNYDISNFSAIVAEPAREFFGRVYFLLDAPDAKSASFDDESNVVERRDDLLVALDARAQGRLVWSRRADDFAPFFPPAPKNVRPNGRFVSLPQTLPNDLLEVQVELNQEVKRFLLDAADGEPRSSESVLH